MSIWCNDRSVCIGGLKQASPVHYSVDELINYARLAIKVMNAYARVFTVGQPAVYRYTGWIDWYSGKREKAFRAWRMAAEKAHSIPMHYEEGLSYPLLARNASSEDPERNVNLDKAQDAFRRGGLDHWVELTNEL